MCARNVRVFGSVVRGDNDEESDVDSLVESVSTCKHVAAFPIRARQRAVFGLF